MKGVFVIIDGVADEPLPNLDNKTPLEYAKTPNLDEISKESDIDHCFVMKEDVAPESSSAVVSLFGEDPNFAPRGPLEAMGSDIPIKKGDLTLRCNFATVENLDGGVILDSRAGRTLTTKEARKLANSINSMGDSKFKAEFYATREHRGVLVFRGGFSDNISNADPFYGMGYAKQVINPKMVFSKPLDDEEDSQLSADLVNRFIRKSYEILDKHPINLKRARKGLYSGNILLCRDAGNEPISFKKLPGKWMALGYNPLEIGIAKAFKMDLYKFKYPRLKTIDVYSHLYRGLKRSLKYSIKMLKKYHKTYDYFYIHIKETDLPGHDNKPLDKVKMIEMIDQKFFYFLKTFIGDAKLVVTADHITSCRKKAHLAGSVPLLVYPSKKTSNKRFTEKDAASGRKFTGKTLLQRTLFVKS